MVTPTNPLTRGPRIEADRESRKIEIVEDRYARHPTRIFWLPFSRFLFVSTSLLMSGFLCRFDT